MRVEPVGCFGESRCVPVHGNAEDSGMCEACEKHDEMFRDARNVKLRAALHAFADQMPGCLWDYAVEATISALVRSLNMDGFCKLCGHHGRDHKAGCAAVALAELI